MKVAVYIENGVTQLVLTPEGEWEESVCGKLASNGDKRVRIMRGSFYECQGGWTRFSTLHQQSNDRSLILRVDDAPAAVSPEAPHGGTP